LLPVQPDALVLVLWFCWPGLARFTSREAPVLPLRKYRLLFSVLHVGAVPMGSSLPRICRVMSPAAGALPRFPVTVLVSLEQLLLLQPEAVEDCTMGVLVLLPPRAITSATSAAGVPENEMLTVALDDAVALKVQAHS
jgi:hypothetical protein